MEYVGSELARRAAADSTAWHDEYNRRRNGSPAAFIGGPTPAPVPPTPPAPAQLPANEATPTGPAFVGDELVARSLAKQARLAAADAARFEPTAGTTVGDDYAARNGWTAEQAANYRDPNWQRVNAIRCTLSRDCLTEADRKAVNSTLDALAAGASTTRAIPAADLDRWMTAAKEGIRLT